MFQIELEKKSSNSSSWWRNLENLNKYDYTVMSEAMLQNMTNFTSTILFFVLFCWKKKERFSMTLFHQKNSPDS